MEGVLLMPNQDFYKRSVPEIERILAEKMKTTLSETLAKGIPVAMSDTKGVYHLHPDGKKEYVKLYDNGGVVDEP